MAEATKPLPTVSVTDRSGRRRHAMVDRLRPTHAGVRVEHIDYPFDRWKTDPARDVDRLCAELANEGIEATPELLAKLLGRGRLKR